MTLGTYDRLTLVSLFDPESKTKAKEGKKPYEAQKSFAIVASPKQDEEGRRKNEASQCPVYIQ